MDMVKHLREWYHAQERLLSISLRLIASLTFQAAALQRVGHTSLYTMKESACCKRSSSFNQNPCCVGIVRSSACTGSAGQRPLLTSPR